MDTTDIITRLECAARAAQIAGGILTQHYGKLRSFDTKASSIDLVTAADRESEERIIREISTAFPNDVMCAEESDGRAANERQVAIETADFAWCVDPLDGTTNFVHTYPNFAVSIGLLAKGVPVLGVIHAPIRGETFVGGHSVPPTRNGVPIAVSKTAGLGESLIATGFPYDRSVSLDRVLKVLKRTLSETHGARRAGSAALDLCDVACGRLEGFYEWSLNPWDVAAGQAIVHAAGGVVTDTNGDTHNLFGGSICASNGRVHQAILGLLGR